MYFMAFSCELMRFAIQLDRMFGLAEDGLMDRLILIPGLNKLKEWAYAGLFFDLFGATYSGIAVSQGNIDPRMAGMLLWIIPGVLSYIFWTKKMKADLIK